MFSTFTKSDEGTLKFKDLKIPWRTCMFFNSKQIFMFNLFVYKIFSDVRLKHLAYSSEKKWIFLIFSHNFPSTYTMHMHDFITLMIFNVYALRTYTRCSYIISVHMHVALEQFLITCIIYMHKFQWCFHIFQHAWLNFKMYLWAENYLIKFM